MKSSVAHYNPTGMGHAREQISISAHCLVCGTQLNRTDMITCTQCNAVDYCSPACQTSDQLGYANSDHSHSQWCNAMKIFMSVEPLLCDLPLGFAHVTTHPNFSIHKLAQFLTAFGVFNLGLWKYEYAMHAMSSHCDSCCLPGDELHQFSALSFVRGFDETEYQTSSFPSESDASYEDAILRAYILPTETVLLCSSPQMSISLHSTDISSLTVIKLSDWPSYYTWRGFSDGSFTGAPWSGFSSPIAVLMHWPLTIFFILQDILPNCNSNSIQTVLQSRLLNIHVIGVEQELSMLPVFKELDYLIRPDLNIRLCFIGPHISPSVDKCVFHLSNRLSVSVWSGTYHEFVQSRGCLESKPDVIIGFNSGLSAYASWAPTLQVISKLNIPTFFTDACLYSCAWGYRVSKLLNLGTVEYYPPSSGPVIDTCEKHTGLQAPILNPFRSPLRIHSQGVRWGWFRNAFIYCPLSPTKTNNDVDELPSMISTLKVE